MEKEFSYVVGYPWGKEYPSKLCIYTYYSEIQYGTKKDAKDFLKYVKSRSDINAHKNYAIYKVKFKKVK